MKKAWHEQNCTVSMSFVVAGASQAREGHCKDVTSHVFSIASKRQPDFIFNLKRSVGATAAYTAAVHSTNCNQPRPHLLIYNVS